MKVYNREGVFKMIFILSRKWNYFVLSVALFFVKITCDYTNKNKDLIDDVTDPIKTLREIIGKVS